MSEEERSFLVKVSDKVEKKRDSAKQKLAGLNNALKLVNERYSQDITKIIQSDNKAEGLNHQQAEEEQQKAEEETELTAEEKRLEEEQLSILLKDSFLLFSSLLS